MGCEQGARATSPPSPATSALSARQVRLDRHCCGRGISCHNADVGAYVHSIALEHPKRPKQIVAATKANEAAAPMKATDQQYATKLVIKKDRCQRIQARY